MFETVSANGLYALADGTPVTVIVLGVVFASLKRLSLQTNSTLAEVIPWLVVVSDVVLGVKFAVYNACPLTTRALLI